MNHSAQAQPRPPQNYIDILCQQRLLAPNFATPQSHLSKLLKWIKAGAK